MHLPFALPPFRQPVKYTEGSEAANGYLNTVKYVSPAKPLVRSDPLELIDPTHTDR